MGPAILLCPSSSAVHLWGLASLSKKTKDGSFSTLQCYPSANVYCTGDLIRRPAFFSHPACPSEKCRKPNYPFAWRRVSAMAAAGGDVSVDEPVLDSGRAPSELATISEPSANNEKSPADTESKTPARRTFSRSNSNANKVTVVSPAELIPGAIFPGKVNSIQSFGAFVDLGAFTNGLVHISRLSKGYVKKVEDVVQIGQEVNVQVLEVDMQGNRISLMLVQEEKEEAGEALEKQTQRPAQQQARTPRRDPSKRPNRTQPVTQMKIGEIATGTVKNMIRSGVFISLPDGTDGYLPVGEVIFKAPNMNLESQFQVGQEVTVRALRIEKGRVTLTTRQEVNFDKLNEELNRGVVGGATNPFEIAFRRNETIASFLSERDKQKNDVEEVKDAVVESREETLENVVKPEEQVKEEEGVTAAEKVEVSADAIDDKLTSEGTDILKEAITAVEEAVVEQAGAAAEEVANLAGSKGQATVVEDTVKEIIASGEEGNVEEAPVLVDGTILEPVVNEEPEKLAHEEGSVAVKEAVGVLRDTVVEQVAISAEQVASLAGEVLAKGASVVVEDSVKENIAAAEENVDVEEPDEADVEGVTACGDKEDQKMEASAETETASTSLLEGRLEEKTEETEEEGDGDDVKELTSESPALQTAGANVQQS